MADHWKRTYWVVWAANLITSIGMMSFLPFFPSLLREMGVVGEASVSRWAGVCFAAAPLSATLSAPVWGAIGDRFGRKVMVCRAMLAIALFVGGMGFASTPYQLLALRLGQGMFSGFIPPSITLVSVGAPDDRQGRIAGSLGTALAVGGLVGPVFGAFLATALGSHRAVFFVVGSLALVAALLVALGAVEDVSKRRVRDAGAPRPSLLDVVRTTGRDVGEVLKSPALRATAFVVFVMQFGLGAVNPIMELYVEGLFHGAAFDGAFWDLVLPYIADGPETLAPRAALVGSAVQGHLILGGGFSGPLFEAAGAGWLTLEERVVTIATGLTFGVMAIANLFSLRRWGKYGDRVGHREALVQCAALAVLALLFQAALPLYLTLLLGRLAMGVGLGGISPLAFGLAASEASADRRGGAFGVVFSARTLAVAVGGTVGGALYPVLGARGVMALAAGLLLLATIQFRGSTLKSRIPAGQGGPV